MIGSLRLYLAIAGIAALAGGGWWVRDLMADKAALVASVAALEREAKIHEYERHQWARSEAIAGEEAARAKDELKRINSQLDAAIAKVKPGEQTPDAVRDLLDGLRRSRDQNTTDRPEGGP